MPGAGDRWPALVPLAIVLARRLRAVHGSSLPRGAAQRAWHGTAPSDRRAAAATREPRARPARWTARVQRALPVLGAAGLGGHRAWRRCCAAIRRRCDSTARQQVASADARVARTRGRRWAGDVAALSVDAARPTTPTRGAWHQFVWREAGARHTKPDRRPGLRRRCGKCAMRASTRRSSPDRAEEWRVTVRRRRQRAAVVRHALPEQRAWRKSRREHDARARAQQSEIIATLRTRSCGTARSIGGGAATATGARRLAFTYADPRVEVGKGGEARVITVDSPATKIVGSGRYVFVPRTWQRAERLRHERLSLAKCDVGAGIAIVAGFAAIIATIVAWSRGALTAARSGWHWVPLARRRDHRHQCLARVRDAAQDRRAAGAANRARRSGDCAVARSARRCSRACWRASRVWAAREHSAPTRARSPMAARAPAPGSSSPASKVWLARRQRRTSAIGALSHDRERMVPVARRARSGRFRAGPRCRGDDHRAALAGRWTDGWPPPPLAGLTALTIATAGAGAR